MSTLQKINKLKIIVILGPTATGKTKLAVKLAAKFKGEIVSADSRQVYCGMDIGTGKDLIDYQLTTDNKRQTKIRCHLINILNPNQKFNVALFKKLTLKAIKDIIQRDHLPIIVGGTGLYLSAIVDNYEIPHVKANGAIRKKLAMMNKAQKVRLLKKLDPDSLKFVATDNPRRLDRALEVCLSGKKFSEIRTTSTSPINPLMIGLTLQKDILKKKIEARVDKMIKQGLVKETKEIVKNFGRSPVVLQTIGYKEIIDYLDKKTTLLEAVALIKLHTYQFAKRQMTWFKRDKRINWVKNKTVINQLIKKFLL